MSHILSPENERFLQDLVSQGNFATEAAALNAAIGLLRQRQEFTARIRVGLDQAVNGQLTSASEVFERLDRRAGEIEKLAEN